MDVPSLTQSQARARAAALDVRRYHVALDLTRLIDGDAVRSTSTVEFACTGTTETFVDCAAEVVRATLNGRELGAQAVSPGRIALHGLAAENVLVVESVQANTRDVPGVRRTTDPGDGSVYLWTSFEPDEARFVWACFDQPDLKAPHGFDVLAPPNWTVLSNTGEATVTDESGARRWVFADTPPLSTYNPVVLGGPFYEIRRDIDGHDLGLYCRASLRDVLDRDADELFEVTAAGLRFFGDTFAMPFPQRAYNQAFLADFGGAMENYGCVAWSDAYLFRASPTPEEREFRAKVLLHEMAHMWFGNIVTMRWWDDLWLNESFAEFACNWAAVEATSFTGAWAQHLAQEKVEAYLADQGPISHPIRQPVEDVAAAAGIFDAITYPKGASVLAQLKEYVGDKAFVAGMRSYFAKHAWGNTVLDDLMAELAAASGRDLDAWTKGWLETAGVDRLELHADGDSHVLIATGPGGGPPRPQVLNVGAYVRGRDGLERAAVVPVDVHGARTPVPGLGDADLYLVNDDDLTFATTRPDAHSRDRLFTDAALLPTPISRAIAVATMWDMLTTAEASASEVVRAISAVLLRETSDSVVEPFLLLIANAAEWWSPDAVRDELMTAVADTCAGLADQPQRRQVAMRTLARCATTSRHLAVVEKAAAGDVDLTWRLLSRRAERGEPVHDAIELALAADPDPDAWLRALAVRTARPDVAAKEEAWRGFFDDRTLPVGMAGPVAKAFWRPGQAALLAPYADRYLTAVRGLGDTDMIVAMTTTARMFPRVAFGNGFLDDAMALARSGALVPAVGNRIVECADEVRRMVDSRSR